jgi:hypothetical protein
MKQTKSIKTLEENIVGQVKEFYKSTMEDFEMPKYETLLFLKLLKKYLHKESNFLLERDVDKNIFLKEWELLDNFKIVSKRKMVKKSFSDSEIYLLGDMSEGIFSYSHPPIFHFQNFINKLEDRKKGYEDKVSLQVYFKANSMEYMGASLDTSIWVDKNGKLFDGSRELSYKDYTNYFNQFTKKINHLEKENYLDIINSLPTKIPLQIAENEKRDFEYFFKNK